MAAVAILGALAVTAADAAPGPETPKLTEVLRYEKGQALIFQPVQMKRG
jgi:hypothetical protein